MSNSAITFNTAGLASTTSPGLVGTGAQTFAGKKTLEGGALIKGDTSGVAIATGYVGEKITWATPPVSQTLTGSMADWTNASLILTSGRWLIVANIQSVYSTGAVAGNYGNVTIQITDTANAIVQNQSKSISTQTSANSSSRIVAIIPFSFVADLASTTTYKIRAQRFDVAGTGTASIFNEATAYAEFFAIRIA